MIECGLATNDDESHRRASELIAASVDRARAAISKYETEVEAVDSAAGRKNRSRRLIAGSIPPLTECYFSAAVSSSVDGMILEYKTIISTLIDCEVDILLAETLSTTREATAILRAVSEVNKMKGRPPPPIVISFTIHDDRPSLLRSGECLQGACRDVIEEAKLLGLTLEAVGVNCATPKAISHAVPIISRTAEGTKTRICVYGNCFKTTTTEWINSLDSDDGDGKNKDAGIQIINDELEYDNDGYMLADVYAKYAMVWLEQGASFIGGCCGSRPEHIHAIAQRIKVEEKVVP